MKNKIISIALLCLVGFLTSCQDRFRYPCQDPVNWDSAQCQKPECEATRTCPDLIIKSEKRMSKPADKPAQIEKKGDCK